MKLTDAQRGPAVFWLLAFFCLPAVMALTAPALGQPEKLGQWEPRFDLPNVAIHVHVLPTGKVLFWSRREWRGNKPAEGLDPHDCTPRILDPVTRMVIETPKPGFNLFCSGHTFLADGRLFVAGGHIADAQGEDKTAIYDPFANTWTRSENTSGGRWYPTAITLADGSVLVSFGSKTPLLLNFSQQVWTDGHFRTIADFIIPPLYPRMHLVSDGRVFMSGPNALTQLLTTKDPSNWVFLRPGDFLASLRSVSIQDYAPSVMFAPGKILYIGGGNPPSDAAQVIDLNAASPQWRATAKMSIGRRHHHATVLPDGTVLVTGGTSGNGGPNFGFNDLAHPVKYAELWDPATESWTKMAEEDIPRCYHGNAVLLPDARVLSAGGGEYRPDNIHDNDLADSHRDAQIFRPPYLFRGPRPTITRAPAEVRYNDSFSVATPDAADVGSVSWMRLSSATHAFNPNQRIIVLDFTTNPAEGSLSVKAPADPNRCPPGHYMLFILNRNKVPSVASIMRIH
jgi:galactose oxidase